MQETEQRIEIGVYGRTQAGKTRFLHELLTHWEKERRILTQSVSCQRFLQLTSDQVGKFDKTLPTTPDSNPEPIELTIRSGASDERASYRLHDLRGEILEGEIDGLDSLEKPNADGLITRQVQHCDAFLFFFDPESWEKPEEVKQHHERELRRAQIFIRYVLNSRQNKYLPIIFVITRVDCWENDAGITALADLWGERVLAELKTAYAQSLQNHFPSGLVTEQRVIAKTSALRTEDVEAVLLNAQELLKDSRKFRREDRKAIKLILYVGLLFLVFAIAIGAWIGTSKSTAKMPEPPIVEQTEGDVLVRTRAFGKLLLQVAPLNPPKDAQVKQMNDELKWLVTTMAVQKTDMPAATKMEIGSISDQLNDLLGKSAIRGPSDLDFSTQILLGVGDAAPLSDDIAAFQKGRYWSLQRESIATSLADSMQTMNAIQSDPVVSLNELMEILDAASQSIEQINVFGPDARKDLLSDLRVASQFCKKYANDKKYNATLKIDSARHDQNGKPELAKHAILISPKTAHAFSLHPRLAGGNTVSFEAQAVNFDLELELSRSVNCVVSKYVNHQWEEVERFDLARDDAPLSVIGMPLHNTSESAIRRNFGNGGYEFVLVFSGLPKVPVLLWTAVGLVETKQK